MRADICDPNDQEAVAKLRRVLRGLRAELEDKNWAIGVDLYRFKIGDAELLVFCDEWSVDIEGSDDLVQKISTEVAQHVA